MRLPMKNICLAESSSGVQMEMWDGNEDNGLPATCFPWKGGRGQA